MLILEIAAGIILAPIVAFLLILLIWPICALIAGVGWD
jgi:hypothetical protein